jgi:hypothetical protein
MKNEFKEYFELSQNLEIQKIHNDYEGNKLVSKLKFKGFIFFSISTFAFIALGLNIYEKFGSKYFNFKFRNKIKFQHLGYKESEYLSCYTNLIDDFNKYEQVFYILLFDRDIRN